MARRLLSSAIRSADVAVVGSGVVGVSCAHYLAARGASVVLIDDRPALSYTSALSTECYRNYWAGNPTMTAFMDRSIDLLEHHARTSGNRFSMNRRGYAFLSATADGAARHVEAARASGGTVHTDAAHGVRYDPNLPFDAPASLHVFSGREATAAFLGSMPQFVADEVCSLKFAGRCGWMNAQQMGSYLLETAREAGARPLAGSTLLGVSVDAGRVSGVRVGNEAGEEQHLSCGAVVNCAGPYAGAVGTLMGGEPLPLRNEIHAKAVLRDTLGAVPAAAPMMIWDDEVTLAWSEEEAEGLAEMGGFEATLAAPLPAGAHLRPYPMGEGAGSLLLLWEALHADIAVAEPPPPTPALREHLFSELLLRGLGPMVPGFGRYLRDDGSMARVSFDGGYYTQVPDNLPLVGPQPGAPAGAYICAGLSGYGVMAANAAGELLAQHVMGEPLPGAYAGAFSPERWLDDAYAESVRSGAVGKGLQI